MRLRKCSLRKMIKDGLVNDQIKRQVLQTLKPIVTNDAFQGSNGDLKETVLFLILRRKFSLNNLQLNELIKAG